MIKLINSRIFCGLICALFCTACNKSGLDNDPVVIKPVVLPAGTTDIINSMSDFAFDFFKSTLNNDNTPTNKLVSPLSVYLALSMVYNGADKATKDSIAHTLRLTTDDIQKLNNVCKALIEELPNVDNKVKLSIANSIWYNIAGSKPIQNFLSVTTQSYHATVNPADFSKSQEALDIINNWVAENTNQKIQKILTEISNDDLMYLVNAIYFKGSWKQKFEISNTINEDFHTSDGTVVSTPFMIQENTIHYVRHNDIQAVELPYSGGAYNMYILLPDDNVNLNQTIKSLNANTFLQILSDTQSVKMTIHLPKWKSSYKMNSLRPALKAMGMDIAFTEQADFGNMYNKSVQITKAIHQTFIEVNEEGTEAAAVTAIGIGTTSTAPPPMIKIDRPFIYVIAEKTSNTILFTGIVNNAALN